MSNFVKFPSFANTIGFAKDHLKHVLKSVTISDAEIREAIDDVATKEFASKILSGEIRHFVNDLGVTIGDNPTSDAQMFVYLTWFFMLLTKYDNELNKTNPDKNELLTQINLAYGAIQCVNYFEKETSFGDCQTPVLELYCQMSYQCGRLGLPFYTKPSSYKNANIKAICS